jgi:hypothetical protein
MKTHTGLCAMALVMALLGSTSFAVKAAAANAQPAAGKGEPAVETLVVEDDSVRIDELRVRGQTQRISVKPKWAGAKAYEIVPGAAGNDPSQHKDSAGQRVWHLLTF